MDKDTIYELKNQIGALNKQIAADDLKHLNDIAHKNDEIGLLKSDLNEAKKELVQLQNRNKFLNTMLKAKQNEK